VKLVISTFKKKWKNPQLFGLYIKYSSIFFFYNLINKSDRKRNKMKNNKTNIDKVEANRYK
jgi:uncharacterized membrane protein